MMLIYRTTWRTLDLALHRISSCRRSSPLRCRTHYMVIHWLWSAPVTACYVRTSTWDVAGPEQRSTSESESLMTSRGDLHTSPTSRYDVTPLADRRTDRQIDRQTYRRLHAEVSEAVLSVTGRFDSSSVRLWTFRPKDVLPSGRIQRLPLIQLKPKHQRTKRPVNELMKGRNRGGSPTAVQAWRPCPLWEPSPLSPHIIVD